MPRRPKKADRTFFDTFKARVKLATDAEADQRRRELADLEFEAGQHWTPEELRSRKQAGKPSITIDLLSGPIKQVMNQQRTARPGIQIDPVGHGADEEAAEQWQGIIRRIERLSKAHRAYTWAGQHQVKMGRGFWIVRNIEVGDDGEQDLRIEAIENQHSVLCDPTAKQLDGSDKRWAILFEDLTHDTYVDRFGESRLAGSLSQGFSAGEGDSVPGWIGADHVRIAEYYYLEDVTRTRIVGLLDQPDGTTQEWRGWQDEAPPEVVPIRLVKKKTTRVQWCLLNGIGDVLDQTTIPGSLIPVVMVYGERRYLDGDRDFRGMVRMNRDASRMEDWAESSLMEAISQAKTAPWLAAFGQIEAHKPVWDRAHILPPAVLPYDPMEVAGNQVPPPQRVSSGVDVSALTLAAQRMQNHVRANTGMADTFAEETSAQQARLSGRAILARRQNQELGTSDYLENLGDGIILTAQILMGMAREIYDTPRLLRILDIEDKPRPLVTYAGADQRGMAQGLVPPQMLSPRLLDVTVGDYDITIRAGRSHATARQEAVDAIAQLPEGIIQAGADIYIGNMDFPGAQEFAKRLKKANPLAKDEEESAIPPAVQQQMAQAQQVIDALTEKWNAARSQMQSQDDDRQSKERIAQAQIEAQIALEQLKFQHDLALEELKARVELEKARMGAMTDMTTTAISAAQEGDREDADEKGDAEETVS